MPDTLQAAVPDPGLSISGASSLAPDTDSFEQRWADWQTRGRVQDAQTSRRMRLVAIVAAIAAGLLSAWLTIPG